LGRKETVYSASIQPFAGEFETSGKGTRILCSLRGEKDLEERGGVNGKKIASLLAKRLRSNGR